MIAFVVSRALYFAAGIRFDAGGVYRNEFWQNLDLSALKGDLVRSIWFLHSQPPLFNLFLGLVFKLPYRLEHTAFRVSYLGFGLLLSTSLYLLMAELGVRRRPALVLSILFTVTPACVLYENWLYYTYPTTALLALAPVLLLRYGRGAGAGYGIGFFAVAAAVVLTRSVYHPLWLVVVAVLVLVGLRRSWRHVALVAAAPVLVVLFWTVKNGLVLDSFGTSSWTGMNLARLLHLQLPPDDLAALIRDHRVSGLARIGPFSRPEAYEGRYDMHQHRGVQVLHDEYKRDGVNPNFNNAAFVRISSDYLEDDVRIIRARPGFYARVVGASLRFAFLPADDYWLLENRHHVSHLQRLVDALLGQPRRYGEKGQIGPYHVVGVAPEPTQLVLLVVAAYAITGLGAPILAWRRRSTDRAGALTLALIWFTVVYAVVVGNALELSENNRFRFETDPLVLAATAVVVSVAWRSRARARGRA